MTYTITVSASPNGKDQARTAYAGYTYAIASRTGAICSLARALLDVGAPDGPWLAYGENGKLRMRGPALTNISRFYVADADSYKRPPHFARWKAKPDMPKSTEADAEGRRLETTPQ